MVTRRYSPILALSRTALSFDFLLSRSKFKKVSARKSRDTVPLKNNMNLDFKTKLEYHESVVNISYSCRYFKCTVTLRSLLTKAISVLPSASSPVERGGRGFMSTEAGEGGGGEAAEVINLFSSTISTKTSTSADSDTVTYCM